MYSSIYSLHHMKSASNCQSFRLCVRQHVWFLSWRVCSSYSCWQQSLIHNRWRSMCVKMHAKANMCTFRQTLVTHTNDTMNLMIQIIIILTCRSEDVWHLPVGGYSSGLCCHDRVSRLANCITHPKTTAARVRLHNRYSSFGVYCCLY